MVDSPLSDVHSERNDPVIAAVNLLQQRSVAASKIDHSTRAIVHHLQSEFHYRRVSLGQFGWIAELVVSRIPLRKVHGRSALRGVRDSVALLGPPRLANGARPGRLW